MENGWNSSRRIFLHVGRDVASFLLPSKASLCCYLCPASFPVRADVWEKQGRCFHPWGAQGLRGIGSPGTLHGGGGNYSQGEQGASPGGKGNLAALASPQGFEQGQNSSARPSLRTQSSTGENNFSFLIDCKNTEIRPRISLLLFLLCPPLCHISLGLIRSLWKVKSSH